jgi:hypothetical protein
MAVLMHLAYGLGEARAFMRPLLRPAETPAGPLPPPFVLTLCASAQTKPPFSNKSLHQNQHTCNSFAVTPDFSQERSDPPSMRATIGKANLQGKTHMLIVVFGLSF